MNKFFFATTLAISVFGFNAIGQADQGIPALGAQPLIAQQLVSVGGEQYPTFSNEATKVVSERVTASNGGENYPTFANPSNGGAASDYAAIGSVVPTQDTEIATAHSIDPFGG